MRQSSRPGGDVKPNAYDVFLSHGSPDKEWVQALYAQLTSAGVVAYLDKVAIEAGENFVRHLSDGLERTSTFVIVVSHGTTDRDWVEHEWTSFLATHGPKTKIIPVLLDHVQLPAFLNPYQAIHAIDRNVEAVAARIARAVGKGNGSGPAAEHAGHAGAIHRPEACSSPSHPSTTTRTSSRSRRPAAHGERSRSRGGKAMPLASR